MRLEVTGRHHTVTPDLRALVGLKLGKLERLLNDSAVSAQVLLAIERGRRHVEVTLHARGENFLHGVGIAATWEMAIGQAVSKLSQQAKKVKGKYQERKRRASRGGSQVEAPKAPAPPARRPAGAPRARLRILKASRQAIKPMTVAEAAREADAGGDGVVVFLNEDTSAISVVFRRGDEIVLIETES